MPIIDFETKSDFDLGEVGLYRYADPRYTHPICMAWDASDMWTPPGVTWDSYGVWWPGESTPPILKHAIAYNATFYAHNSEFDEAIWEVVCGFPRVMWVDTMALAAYNGFPLGLDEIGKALGLGGKDKPGRAAMLKMGKPPFPDTPQLRVDCGRYAFDDVAKVKALLAHCDPLTPALQAAYAAHRVINERGVSVDMNAVALIMRMLQNYTDARVLPLEAELGFRLTQRDVLLKWLNARGAGLENLQAEVLERWLANPRHEDNFDYDEYTRSVVKARLLAGLASVKKYKVLANMVSIDWRLRGQYQFLTAKSGRHSSKGVQVHNLIRSAVDDLFFELIHVFDASGAIAAILGDPFEQCSKAVRQCFAAEEGNELIAADYAQVELRIILWLAGEYAQLDKLAAGNDLYIELAWEIFGDWTLTKKDNDFERQVGKKGKLGCGYGVGPDTFQEMCAKEGISIDRGVAARTVRAYRTTTPGVVTFWDCVEEAYEAAFQGSGEMVDLTMVAGGPSISFQVEGENLLVFLPSGRRLIYREAVFSGDGLSYMGVHPKTHQWTRLRIWGSAMTGHIVQGIAACLLHDATVRLNAHYAIVLHTHDEIVIEAPKGLVLPKEFGDRMAEAPAWAKTRAKNLPIAVDVFSGPRYKKG